MSPKRAGESLVEGVDATVQGVAADAGEGQAGESATRRKRRGHRPGTQGKSHSNKHMFEKKFMVNMYGSCGRTDV